MNYNNTSYSFCQEDVRARYLSSISPSRFFHRTG